MLDRNLITPAIMSGGPGARMWPVSRKGDPKQFHDLFASQSLFQDTIARISPDMGPFAPPIILASLRHRALIDAQLAETAAERAQLILEPMPRNTAPAIATLAVAAEARSPGGLILVVPADQRIADAKAFGQAMAQGRSAALDGAIVTFGLKPRHPETGYGYIQAGDAIDDHARKVVAFREKPDLDTATAYVDSGAYYWNAGIFMFRTDVMIEELAKHAPETLDAARRAVAQGDDADDVLLLDAEAFQAAPDISIDYAVMERTDRAAVVPMDLAWSDIGSWGALWEVADKDDDGNAANEPAVLIDAQDNLIVSNGQKVAAIGVRDLVIVTTPDGVLVMSRERSQDVKKIVQSLKASGETDLL